MKCASSATNLSKWKVFAQYKTRMDSKMKSRIAATDAVLRPGLLEQVVLGEETALSELECYCKLIKLNGDAVPPLVCVVDGHKYQVVPCSQIPVKNMQIGRGMK
jgi:hypothetical protein